MRPSVLPLQSAVFQVEGLTLEEPARKLSPSGWLALIRTAAGGCKKRLRYNSQKIIVSVLVNHRIYSGGSPTADATAGPLAGPELIQKRADNFQIWFSTRDRVLLHLDYDVLTSKYQQHW